MFLSPKQNSYNINVFTSIRGKLHPSTFLHSLISLVILVAYVIIFISATNEQLFTFDRGQLLVPSSLREFPPGKNISGKDSSKTKVGRTLVSVSVEGIIGGICLQIHTRWMDGYLGRRAKRRIQGRWGGRTRAENNCYHHSSKSFLQPLIK